MNKTCKRCGESKTLRNFRKQHDKNGKEFPATYCNTCHAEYNKAWRRGEWDKLHPQVSA